MAILYLVRHGETEHNANHIIQGQINSPLTDLGESQAEATADSLKEIDFSACYYSPLGRTTLTAQTILKHHDIKATPRNELMEFDMGELEGKINDHTIHGEAFENFARFPHKYITPVAGGENYDTLTERVYNCCKELAEQHKSDDKILIVSHGGPIRSLINPLINKPRSEFWFDPDVTPASVSIVKWDSDSDPELITFSDTPVEELDYDNSEIASVIRPN